MIPTDDLRLYELFVRYWDNDLTPAEAEELDGRLAAEPRAREWFQLFTMQAVAAAELPTSTRREVEREVERERAGEFPSPSEIPPEPQPHMPASQVLINHENKNGVGHGGKRQYFGGRLAVGLGGIAIGRWLWDDRTGNPCSWSISKEL